jgi:hypothetical protein
MRWRTFVNLAIGFLLPFTITNYYRQVTNHANEKVNGVIACIENPAYAGVTPEDNAHLFAQCLTDYKGAK